MKQLSILLEQKAHVGGRVRRDFVRQTIDHLPGWTVRGAFAAAWIRRYGAPSPTNPRRAEFVRLFEGGVRFGPLYAGEPPVSLAVIGHKYRPLDECDPVEIDRAADRRVPESCSGCGNDFEPQKGLRQRDGLLITRRVGVQIGDDGVAVDEKLYAVESIAAGSTFSGQLIGQDSDVEAVVGLPGVLIGGRRTTHGGVQASCRDFPDDPTAQWVAKRTLVIRLASAAVFIDDTGRPVPHPTTRELSAQLGVSVTVERSWYRWEQVGGWHAASGLPKPTETAVAAGSTYLCTVDGQVDQETLTRLSRRGLGIRRHEGFGHLTGPTHLSWTSRQRRDLAVRLGAVRNNDMVPAEFVQDLHAYALGGPRSRVDQHINEVSGRDRYAAAPMRGLAGAPRPELRRLLATAAGQ